MPDKAMRCIPFFLKQSALLMLCLLLIACDADQTSGLSGEARAAAQRPSHHRDDGFSNSDGSRVNKPLSELLRWWWSRQAIDLDALVAPDRIKAAWAQMPQAWQAEITNGSTETAGLHRHEVQWLGHATIVLRIGETRILTDPHFSERASPLSWIGPKRLHPVPLTIAELGRIDYVLISHNHYDHLDLPSLRQIAQQHGGPPVMLVPLGVDVWLKEAGFERVLGFDWWEQNRLGDFAFHFVPAHHWSGRGLWDRNKTLWGGWVVDHPSFRFFFAGDTGWSDDVHDIAKRFAPFDLAAIPVGAYEPRWFMANQHINPHEAVRMHQALGKPLSLGIHWGTFQLTDEAYEDPIKDLIAAMKHEAIALDRFRLFVPGQTL
ncbi:MAG TPA: MBL fold metallo-hydrolase, partial [Lautropia sp.]|nr:MBL fold metallo-hydrolase [Lautropia sp.]